MARGREGRTGVSLKRFAAKSIIRRERTTAAGKEKEKEEEEKRRLCDAVGVGFPSPLSFLPKWTCHYGQTKAGYSAIHKLISMQASLLP